MLSGSWGRARTSEGEWWQGATAGFKGSSSLCEPMLYQSLSPLPQAVLIVAPVHMIDLLGPCRTYPVFVALWGHTDQWTVQTESSLTGCSPSSKLAWGGRKKHNPRTIPPYHCVRSGTSESASFKLGGTKLLIYLE